MKATMQARLVSCKTVDRQITIEVTNLGDKRQRSSKKDKAITLVPTTTLLVEGIATKKIAYFMDLINEDNEIILKLDLGNNLSVVTDIIDAKVNGINISLSEVDNEIKEKIESEQENVSNLVTFFILVILLIIMAYGLNFIWS
ncbi:MAG: hypothetical protein KGV46_02905 [Pasteurella sp.]|nr:hypothetical protein [Pasteurella sp.]